MEMSKKKYAPVFVFLAGCLWGIIGLFVRQMTAFGFTSMETTALRSIAALAVMMVFLLIYNRKLLRVRLKDIWCFVGTGLFSLSFFNICYFKTMSQTSLSVAAILLYTAPSMVILMSAVLFHERLNMRKLISLILAFAGCVLVTGVLTEHANLTGMGILTGLGAGFGYALYSIFGRYALNRNYQALTITVYTFLFSVAGLVPMISWKHVITLTAGHPQSILIAMALGVVSTIAPYILYTIGLSGMESGRASIIASVEPVVASLLGIIIFHESISFSGIAGMVLVFLSIMIVNIKSASEN